MKPSFLIIGAAKSGTTSLYDWLRQHPQVYMSEPKEPRFFELEYDRGMEFYWNTYYENWAGEPVVGEASPRNLFLSYVPARIRAELPNARLLAILRNPTDRAFSAWWMAYSLGVEDLRFGDAIAANLRQLESGLTFDSEEIWGEAIRWGRTKPRTKYRWYLDMGHYASQLKRYLYLFPEKQMEVLFFEELCSRPQQTLAAVCNFIGADPNFHLAETEPQMVGTPKLGLPLLRVAQMTHIQHLIPKKIRTLVADVLANHGGKPTMAPAMRQRLVDYYYDHNRQLESIVGRDLSHWDS